MTAHRRGGESLRITVLGLIALLVVSARASAQAPPPGPLFSTPVITACSAGDCGIYGQTALGDVNGDGNLDIVSQVPVPPWTLPGTSTSIQVFLGDGSGGFSLPSIQTFSHPPDESLEPRACADLNGDGLDDVVVFNGWGPRILLSTPAGLVLQAQSYPHSAGVHRGSNLFIVDMDGDGVVEVVYSWGQATAAGCSGELSIRSFSPSQGMLVPIFFHLEVQAIPVIPQIGDYNGDGLIDVTFLRYCWDGSMASPLVVLVAQTSPMQFVVRPPLPIPATGLAGPGIVSSSYAGDTNGDGVDEYVLVVKSNGVGQLVAFMGAPDPWTFGSVASQSLPYLSLPNLGYTDHGAWSKALDMDLDGRDELVGVAGSLIGRMPSGAPAGAAIEIGGGVAGYDFVAGDVDNDGDIDLVFMGGFPAGGPHAIHTFLNQTIHKPGCGSSLRVSATTASPGNAGFVVSLSGATPNALALLAFSVGEGQSSAGGCSLWLDFSPGLFYLPFGHGLFVTDAQGTASFQLPIPNNPALTGLKVYAQWLAEDPSGSFPIGPFLFQSSESRMFVIW